MRRNKEYTIIYAFKLTDKEEIVLGKNETPFRTQFVTCMCDNDGKNCFWGHYFDNEVKALKDLVARIEREVHE